ncbi:MAG TPA: endonuclease/exonuclease/phosphatase family protein [Vicinamibacteria bacterium]|nr:endonuclease/exonuclease/phosphatase family protein [Vicinamibacteria bacterium]
MRIVTYNIHRSRGMDGRVRPERIVDVLREIGGDVIALQEVVSIAGSSPKLDQARFFADELGMHLALGFVRMFRGGDYGNVVLSRFPLRNSGCYDLSVPRREKRGCLRVDVELSEERVLHVFNIHLGTAYLERRRQGRKIVAARIIDGDDLFGPRVVLGDFNEWTAGLTSRILAARLNSVDIRTHLRRSRTYPGLFPVLHLDHIYFDDALELEKLALHRTRAALVASDHLPLVADFRIAALGGTGIEQRAGTETA